MGASDNKAAVEQALEALNAGDLERYLELHDRTCMTADVHGLLVQIGAIPAPG